MLKISQVYRKHWIAHNFIIKQFTTQKNSVIAIGILVTAFSWSDVFAIQVFKNSKHSGLVFLKHGRKLASLISLLKKANAKLCPY